jgi:hypothetical protein
LNALDKVIGIPFSRLTRVDVPSARARRASANRRITASVSSDAVPSTSPVAASMARWDSLPCGSTHSPSMWDRMRSRSVRDSAVTVTAAPCAGKISALAVC